MSTNVMNMHGGALSIQVLALIAEMLERGGDVYVRNCAVRTDAPISKELGFEVFREEHNGVWIPRVEPIVKESK